MGKAGGHALRERKQRVFSPGVARVACSGR
jgi:hypothetical protein